jgi:hypothetical protein
MSGELLVEGWYASSESSSSSPSPFSSPSSSSSLPRLYRSFLVVLLLVLLAATVASASASEDAVALWVREPDDAVRLGREARDEVHELFLLDAFEEEGSDGLPALGRGHGGFNPGTIAEASA